MLPRVFPSPWDTRDVLSAMTVVAHQGGWDEILMVLVPIAVFGLLLKVASSRARAASGPSGQRRQRRLTDVRPD